MGAVAETVVDEGEAKAIGTMFVIIPVVEFGCWEGGRGLHGNIQDSRCFCHDCVCGFVLVSFLSLVFGSWSKKKYLEDLSGERETKNHVRLS